tara:strand:- start:1541 stop:2500 length:960 start_codon:yes stop_codon:yes gene_type:complete
MNDMVEKSLSAKSVSIMPIMLMGFVHVIVTPLRDVFSIEPLLMIPYYLFGIFLGIIIYRKSSTVKDFEYQRSKVMKKMKNVYAAEEAGVWQTNVEVPSEISNQSNLSAEVSQISNEAPELELSDEDKVEVSMLNESKSVIEATRRVSGKSTFDDQEVKSTIGATRKTSPMDRVLDFILGIFSKKSANISREEQRIAALKIASEAAPVRAEKPQAPIQYERNEVDLGPDANYVDDFNEQSDQNSKSKDSPQTQEAKDYSSFIPSNNVVKASQSLESMAMLPSSNPSNFNQPSQNQSAVCRSCGYPVKPGDRFCDNCGLEL